jgi:predicted lipoprotein with Yx(FWY)xxD motif
MLKRGWTATGAATGLGGLVLLLAACGGSSGSSMNAGSAYGGSSMSPSPTASSMMGGGSTNGMGTTTATLTMKTTKIGKVLTDSKGDTLYVYSKDMRGAASTCTMSCAKEWPAVKGKAVAAMGVTFAGSLGSVKDMDGTVQATYDGYPLYTYAGDMAPGETSGNGAGGVWHVITGSLLVKSSGGMMASPTPSKSMGMSSGSGGMGYGGGTQVGSGSSGMSSGSGSSGMGSGSGSGSAGMGSGSSSSSKTTAKHHTSPPAPPSTPAAAPTTPAPPAPVVTSPVNGGGCGSGSCW